MKVFIKTLTCATTVSVLLSCDTGTNNIEPSSPPSSSLLCKVAAQAYGYGEVPEDIKELDGYKKLDSSCESEQKKLVVVYDLYPKEQDINWDYVYSHLPGYKRGSGRVESGGASVGRDGQISDIYYSVNGVKMTQEEYDAYDAEFRRKYSEELDRTKRILDIPCSISDKIALLTDEEMAELKKKYGNLAIYDYTGVGSLDEGAKGVDDGKKRCE